MDESTPPAQENSPPTRRVWIAVGACVLVLGLWLIDFHIDIKDRDAFSWMDPYQYYTLATRLAAGEIGLQDFNLPTLFPVVALTVVSIDDSIPSALWINGVFAVLLAFAVVSLCRGLHLRLPPALAILGVLCSPLLLGLSRELYLEFSLAALVAVQYAVWLRAKEFSRPGWVIIFGALFGLGLMWKMTWPVFFAAPAVAQALMLMARGRTRAFTMMIAAFVMPAIVVVVVQMTVFETTLDYYRTLGNTTIPIMNLIGPHEVAQPSSLVYYLVQFGRVGLFLLTPLIVLSFLGLKSMRRLRDDESARRQLILWLWLLSPLVILVLTPVKEPRHIAPCVVPAVLLMLMGIERIVAPRTRLLGAFALVALSIGSYIAVTTRLLPVPYFLDRPLKLEAQLAAMRRNDPIMPPTLDDLHWCHARNIVIAGFELNEALALAWRLRPAAVFDLDLYASRETLADQRPFERYEDLFTLTAFNLYNRRCGYERFLDTLTRSEVIQHADFALMKNRSPDYAAATLPQHERVATISLSDGDVQVLRRRDANTAPYRVLYGARFAAQNPDMNDDERDVLFLDLYKAMQARNPTFDPALVLNLPDSGGDLVFPRTYEPSPPARNIRFYAFYDALYQFYDQIAARNQPQ